MPCRQPLTQAYSESQIVPMPQKQAWQGQALAQGCLTPLHRGTLRERLSLASLNPKVYSVTRF